MQSQMTHKRFRYLIYTDFYRVFEDYRIKDFFRGILFNEGLKYIFWMRLCKFLKNKKALKILFYPISKGILRHYKYKFGISIPFITEIGCGFYIGHFGGIEINSRTVVGKKCNISQGVTIGKKNRGENRGSPIIGDNVYIGPGAKIFGNVKIGNNVAIGANCVVTKDVPDNAVIVGVPGKIISDQGSSDYINKTDYKEFSVFY